VCGAAGAAAMTGLEGDNGLRLYLYCLAGSAWDWAREPERVAAFDRLAREGLRGVDDRHPIQMLHAEGIVAVCSTVQAADFLDENMQQLQWLAPRAMRHDSVAAAVMRMAPVLPVRFGRLFHGRHSLLAFLERHHADMLWRLDQLRDKSEWSVKGYLDEERVRRVQTDTDPALRSSRGGCLSNSNSFGARFLQQKRFDEAVERAIQTHVTRCANEVQQGLAAHAVASNMLRCHGSALSGYVERMVFNISFLVDRQRLGVFRDEVWVRCDGMARTGLSLEMSGPWPPCNFCDELPPETG